jgi:hypothetical protein
MMHWQKRHALQLASQLPDDPEDARAVIRYLTQLVDLVEQLSEPAPQVSRPVLAFHKPLADS